MIAELPAAFRDGCHWALYVRAIVGPSGLPSTEIPAGLPVKARAEAAKRSVAVSAIRKVLYPDG